MAELNKVLASFSNKGGWFSIKTSDALATLCTNSNLWKNHQEMLYHCDLLAQLDTVAKYPHVYPGN